MQHRPETPEGHDSTDVVELRVHGVGGATPEELLDVPLTRRVGGDASAGFFRPWLDRGRSPVLEGYSWGGLTSASRLRALWVLLTPFALVNLAGWMIRHGGEASDPGRRRRTVIESAAAALVRFFGLVVTVGVVGYVVTGAVDLVAYQCGARPTCVSDRWWLSAFDNRLVDDRLGRVLAVGALGAAAVVGAIAWVARRSQHAVHPGSEEAAFGGDDDPAYEVNLSHRALWASPHVAHRLGLTHLAAGTVTVGTVLSHVLDVMGLADTAFLTALGWALLGGAALATLRLDGVASAVHWSLAVGAGLQLAVALVVAGTAGDLAAEAGALPGSRVVADIVLPLAPAAAFLAGVAMVALWARQRTTPLRMTMVAPALLLAGSGLVDAFGSGLLIRLADILGSPVVASDYPMAGSATEPPIVYTDLVGDVAVVTVLTMAVLAVVGLVVWARAGDGPECEELAERFADRGGLDCGHAPDRAWARRVGRAEAIASVTDQAAAVVVWVTAVVVVVMAGAVVSGADGSGLRLGSWADRLAGPASVVLGILPVVAVFGITRLYRSRAVRRVVGVVWDVATFWPRWFHPWAPPAYGERAVPQLGDRLAVLTERGSVVLSAHSQGSALAFATLRLADDRVAGRTALLTHGSPLDRLYARYFPESMSTASFTGLAARLGGWVNLWRVTDYIGGPIEAWGVSDAAVVDPPSSRPPARGEARPTVMGHSHFDRTPEYETAMEGLVRRLER